MKYATAIVGLLIPATLIACAHTTPTSHTTDSDPAQTLFTQAQNQNIITFEDYAFLGKPYQALWSIGNASHESWGSSGTLAHIGFKLDQGKDINDLLKLLASKKLPGLSVQLTDRTRFGNLRSPLADTSFTGDFFLLLNKPVLFGDNVQEEDAKWEATLFIPTVSFSIDNLNIPAGLDVTYNNTLHAMVEFHNQRELEAKNNKPTTLQMYRSSLNRGTFGEPDEGDEEEEEENQSE